MAHIWSRETYPFPFKSSRPTKKVFLGIGSRAKNLLQVRIMHCADADVQRINHFAMSLMRRLGKKLNIRFRPRLELLKIPRLAVAVHSGSVEGLGSNRMMENPTK